MSDGPGIEDLRAFMQQWSTEELTAFVCCVRTTENDPIPKDRSLLIDHAISELFWAYNSKGLAATKRKSAQAKSLLHDILPAQLKNKLVEPDQVRESHAYAKPLSYDFLMREACKKLGIQDTHCEPIDVLEIYLFETVIAKMLVAMNARQRHELLTRRLQFNGMAATFQNSELGGPTTTLAALSIAQASGFGVYLGATSALGLLSHGLGVTLPFAVYTGMTSTIAFAIGPFGFLATAAWFTHVLTSPEWTRIIRGLLHAVAMKAKYLDSTNKLVAGSGHSLAP